MWGEFAGHNQTESPSQQYEDGASTYSNREVDRRQPAQRPKIPQMCAARNRGIKSSTRHLNPHEDRPLRVAGSTTVRPVATGCSTRTRLNLAAPCVKGAEANISCHSRSGRSARRTGPIGRLPLPDRMSHSVTFTPERARCSQSARCNLRGRWNVRAATPGRSECLIRPLGAGRTLAEHWPDRMSHSVTYAPERARCSQSARCNLRGRWNVRAATPGRSECLIRSLGAGRNPATPERPTPRSTRTIDLSERNNLHHLRIPPSTEISYETSCRSTYPTSNDPRFARQTIRYAPQIAKHVETWTLSSFIETSETPRQAPILLWPILTVSAYISASARVDR